MQLRTLADLKGDPENPRQIGKEALAGLQESMAKFGDLSGITWNRRTEQVVAGHQRLDGLRKRYGNLPIHIEGERAWIDIPGPDAARPTVGARRFNLRIVDWDAKTQRAANIAANSPAIAGTFTDALQSQLDEIRSADEKLFNDIRLGELVKVEPERPTPGRDNEPPARAKAKAKTGDLYILGEHRLICGDCTNTEHVDKLMDGHRASLVYTDPPYGVDYESQAADPALRRIVGDEKKDGDLIKKIILPAFRQAARVTEPGAAFYIWHASETRDEFKYAMTAAGLVERQYIIWIKAGFVLGHADYHWGHEPCFYAHKEGQSPLFYGDRTQQTVWTATLSRLGAKGSELAVSLGQGVHLVDGQGGSVFLQARPPRNKKVRKLQVAPGQVLAFAGDTAASTAWMVAKDSKVQHPNQKPVELALRAIENSSQPGQIVIDWFGGSGATLIGCEEARRRCFMSEKDAIHVDQIIERWERFTGRKARLA